MTQPAATSTVAVRVPAKVNVQLSVGGVRPDGFHGLANVFLAVGLYDSVSATRAEAPRLTVSGPDAAQIPLDDSNLAVRAARLLAQRHGLAPDVHLHIAKDILVAAWAWRAAARTRRAPCWRVTRCGGRVHPRRNCWSCAPSWAPTCPSACWAGPRWAGAGARSSRRWR